MRTLNWFSVLPNISSRKGAANSWYITTFFQYLASQPDLNGLDRAHFSQVGWFASNAVTQSCVSSSSGVMGEMFSLQTFSHRTIADF
jgi:hypothetical protein